MKTNFTENQISFVYLPESHNVRKRELPFEQNQKPTEAEKHVAAFLALYRQQQKYLQWKMFKTNEKAYQLVGGYVKRNVRYHSYAFRIEILTNWLFCLSHLFSSIRQNINKKKSTNWLGQAK